LSELLTACTCNLGFTGQAGATGNVGPAGGVGFTGNTGYTGYTGATGGSGATGSRGPQGFRGDPGRAGARGALGATGSTGPIGSCYTALYTANISDLLSGWNAAEKMRTASTIYRPSSNLVKSMASTCSKMCLFIPTVVS